MANQTITECVRFQWESNGIRTWVSSCASSKGWRVKFCLFDGWWNGKKDRKERKTANAVILCAFHLICVRCRTPFQMLTFKFELD